MQQERRRVRREMRFEAAIEGLRTGSPVDAENSLVDLSQIRSITYPQALQVLGFAANNVSSWLEVRGGDTSFVIAAVSPSINALKLYAKTFGNERVVTDELASLSSKIVAGFILAEPQSYSKQLVQVRKGRFGEPKMVLSGLAVVLLDKGDRGEEYGEGHSSTIARVLDDVIALNDPELVEPIKLAFPLEWLDGGFGEKDLKEQFPRVHQFLEQPLLHPEERHVALARMFVASGESQREQLKERIKQGEFGDAFDVLGKVVGVLASHETEEEETSQTSSRDMDLLTEDLWIGLLEMNRRDPRLRPLREKFIGKEWYWDKESVIYTLTETMDGMAVPIGEEETFIAKHQDEILVRLRNEFSFIEDTGRKYRDGLELTYQRRELNNRLAAVLEEVRQILRDNSGRSAEKVMPNKLLFASIYSPVKSREV